MGARSEHHNPPKWRSTKSLVERLNSGNAQMVSFDRRETPDAEAVSTDVETRCKGRQRVLLNIELAVVVDPGIGRKRDVDQDRRAKSRARFRVSR